MKSTFAKITAALALMATSAAALAANSDCCDSIVCCMKMLCGAC